MITFPGHISKISTMADRTVRWQIDMARELSDEEMTEAMKFRGRDAAIAFKETPFTDEEVESLPDVEVSHQKTPSQRLRAVLYRVWEAASPPKFNDFEVWYKNEMERIIDHYKDKLE